MACAAVRTGLPDIAGWQAHCAAMTNAARCDGRCTALRWAMHCAAIIGREHGHVARSSKRRSAHPASVCESCLSSACRMLPAWPFSSPPGAFPSAAEAYGRDFSSSTPKTVPAESGFPPFLAPTVPGNHWTKSPQEVKLPKPSFTGCRRRCGTASPFPS